jgi:hypothetical protein
MIAAANKHVVLFTVALAMFLFLLELGPLSIAQTTVATGSIVGTVSDPSGAVMAAAKIAITNVDTGQVVELTTNSSGSFNSGALFPGNYKILVSAKGFSSAEASVTVLVGNTATVNVNLLLGQESQVFQVHGSEIRVNTAHYRARCAECRAD